MTDNQRYDVSLHYAEHCGWPDGFMNWAEPVSAPHIARLAFDWPLRGEPVAGSDIGEK
jgi:hypothetical protein